MVPIKQKQDALYKKKAAIIEKELLYVKNITAEMKIKPNSTVRR